MFIHELVAQYADERSTDIAFVSGRARLTWEEVHRRSRRLANGLRSKGVKPGDVVASMMWDSHETAEVLIACSMLGAVRTGINPRFSLDEVAHIITDSGATVLVVEDGATFSTAHQVADLVGRPVGLVVVGETSELEANVTAYEDLIREHSEVTSAQTCTPDQLIAISYTSGSTGVPKGALWTHGAFAEASTQTWPRLGIGPDDVYLHSLPAAGVPILTLVGNLFTGGGTCVIQGKFSSEEALRLVEHERVTATLWIPTMLVDILSSELLPDTDLSSLRLLIYGSMPASPALVRRAMDTFGCEINQIYGSTEGTGGFFTRLTHEDHVAALNGNPRLLETVGRPFAHSTVEVVNEAGEEVAAGEIGEVRVKSRTLFAGYLGLPDQTSTALRDGWLYTGDMGRFDQNGYLQLVERKDFMVISGGYNVHPLVTENCLAELGWIREACVFGVPDERWGEVLCAVVVLGDTAPAVEEVPQRAIDHCRDRLGPLSVPREVHVVPSLPRGSTGKVLKRDLRSEYRNRRAVSGPS